MCMPHYTGPLHHSELLEDDFVSKLSPEITEAFLRHHEPLASVPSARACRGCGAPLPPGLNKTCAYCQGTRGSDGD